MTTLTSSRAQAWMMGGVALGALFMVAFAIVASGTLAHAPDRIAFGVVLGITVIATLIAWWRGVRQSALPGGIALAVFAWGVVAARAWVPTAPLAMLVAVGGMAELVTVGWLALRVRSMVQTARAVRKTGRSDRPKLG